LPVKIICIGRNYVSHVRELNNDIPGEPVFFMKPDSSILRKNAPFFLPDWTNDLHHEIELVIRINRLGKNIEKRFADRYFSEVGLGVDFTARDIQNYLIENGLPWEKCKAFDGSAVIGSSFVSVDSLPDKNNINFSLKINDKTVQEGKSSMMIFSFEDIISHVSQFMTLKMGDLIYTGTPVGVGPVSIGDHLEGYLENMKMFDFKVK
jgi:acylpyruvate hydrolase